jgi:hypothetical protein
MARVNDWRGHPRAAKHTHTHTQGSCPPNGQLLHVCAIVANELTTDHIKTRQRIEL